MKAGMKCLILSLLLGSNIACSASSSGIPVGSYSYTQKGDELIDGQRASVTWVITVKDDENAIVDISSIHTPFICDGVYKIANKTDHMALNWSATENTDTECDLSAPQILLKKENGKVLIHSELFPWDSKGWKVVRVIQK
ncbi:hypothetical protein ACLBW0_24660 [Enterobacteriaceae bacterium C34A]